MTLIYEAIFKKMEILGVFAVPQFQSKHLKSGGFMDLVVENLGNNRYSMTHYYEQNGDLVPDPDMEIRVFPESRAAEAMTYQDTYEFRQVYSDNDKKVDLWAKAELNTFLNRWLTNLINQGFAKKTKVGKHKSVKVRGHKRR